MSRPSFLGRMFRRSNSGVPAGWQFPTIGGAPSAAGVVVDQQSAMSVSAVYACVKIISTDIAKLRPVIYRRRGPDRREIVTDHPLNVLLSKPNPRQNWFDFARFMTASVLLRGNGYAPLVSSVRGVPQKWIPINPDRCVLLESGNGDVFVQVARYGLWEMAMLRDLPVAIDADQVLHLKNLGANALLGVSPIAAARQAIGLAIAQEQHAGQMFGNGARPSGILTTDRKLSELAAKQVKTRWQDAHSGPNAGGTAVLEEGLKWQSISLSSVDAEFIAQRRFSVEEIARIYRVPMHMLNVLERATFSNIEQQHQAYLSDTLSEYIEMWVQTLGALFDLDSKDLFVEFDTTKLLRNDTMARYNAYRVGIMSGFLKINEARVAEGYSPEDGGDELLRPVNMMPVDPAAQPAPGADPAGGFDPQGGPPGSDMSGAVPDGGDGDPAKTVNQ